MSLALAGISSTGSRRAVNVVLPRLIPGAVFAGIQTALDVGFALAEQSSLPLRFIAFGIESLPAQRRKITAMLAERGRPGGRDVSVIPINDVTATQFSPKDVWVATHWATAHALDIAARLGRISPAHVIYLIQDYEPGFNPWSSDYTIAEATYRAGFVPLVNSLPLAKYLDTHAGMGVPRSQTFAPQLDLVQLARAADDRAEQARRVSAGERTHILFYGRPNTPKNMFPLGVATLRAATAQLAGEGISLTVTSIGERHPHVNLGAGNGQKMRSIGRVSWRDYFDHLAHSAVVLSLQASPHPSHPPLDSIASGGFAVTNNFGGGRAGLHERLLVEAPEPEALADALVRAVHASASQTASPAFDASFLATLGVPLDSAVAATLKKLGV